MSDSQIPIEYQLNEEGLFSSFNERLQAIDSSLSWLMVKSLRRQGESVNKKDGSKTRSLLFSSTGFPALSSQQDTRIRSSSFSGRPSSRASTSSSSSSAASVPLSTFSSSEHLAYGGPDSNIPLDNLSSVPSPAPSSLSSSSLPFSSDPCRYSHDESPSSSSPSVRAREDLHYHRYHTMMHHYSYPPPPPPPPPASYFSNYDNPTPDYYMYPSSASYHSSIPPPPPLPAYPLYLHPQQLDTEAQNVQQIYQQQLEQQQLQQQHILNQHSDPQPNRLDESQTQSDMEDREDMEEKWNEQVDQQINEDELEDSKNDIEKLQIQNDNLLEESIDELTVDDLAPKLDNSKQTKENQEITENLEKSDNVENPEKSDNSENPEKTENQQNIEKQTNNETTPKSKSTKPVTKSISKWIHSEDSSDDSNDDVVLPKDLPPPPTSPSISPHQLTKPSPNSSEKLYQDFVYDLTGRIPGTTLLYSSASSRHQKLKTSSSTSNLEIASSYPATPLQHSASYSSKIPSSKPSSQHLTRSLPIPSPSPSSSSRTPVFSTPSPADMRHMTRSLSNLEYVRSTQASHGRTQTRHMNARNGEREEADAALLSKELRNLDQTLQSINRVEERIGEKERARRTRASLDSLREITEMRGSDSVSSHTTNYDGDIERIDSMYRPGAAPTNARPPPSPSSHVLPTSSSRSPSRSISYPHMSLDDSLREEVRRLTDNLSGLDAAITRERRSMSVECDSRPTSQQSYSQSHSHSRSHSYLSNYPYSQVQQQVHSRSQGPVYAVEGRRNNEGGVPVKEANVDGNFVIPLSYNEYISVLAKRYQDKASHVTKPSPAIGMPLTTTSKKLTPKKKKTSLGELRKPPSETAENRRRAHSSEFS